MSCKNLLKSLGHTIRMEVWYEQTTIENILQKRLDSLNGFDNI